MTRLDPRRAGVTRTALIFTVVVIVAVVAVGVVGMVLWKPSSSVAAIEPPSPARAGLESALVARIDEATAAVRARPGDPQAWGRLGAVYDVHDLFAEAIVCYAQAERLDPDAFHWPYLLGRCRMVGDQRAALADFERARALDDDYAPLHLRLGSGYVHLDDLDRAQAAYMRAAVLDPSLTRAHLGLARVALARDDAAGALAHLERAVAAGATSGELHGLLAEAHRRLGDLETAADHVKRAATGVKLEPLPDPIHRELGWSEGVTIRWHDVRGKQYMREGKLEAALREWETAVRENPDAVPPLANLAMLYARAGRHADAIKAFTRVVEMDPTRVGAQLDIATLHIRQGDLDKGLDLMRGICAAHPDDVAARTRLARALREAKRESEAEDVLQEALGIDANSAPVLFEYGVLTGESGRMREAVDLFRRSVRADPTSMNAHRNLARAFYRLGLFAEAIAALQEGLTHLPYDVRLSNALAWIRATCPDATQRDGREAVRLAEDICRRTSYRDLPTLDTLGAAYAEVGNFDAAIRALEQALDLPTARNPNVARGLQTRLARYRNRQPHRDANLNE